MALGDLGVAAGYAKVPSTGVGAEVSKGADEINRTRDYVAGVKNSVPTTPTAYRTNAGITSGTTVPSNTVGADGDIFFKYT